MRLPASLVVLTLTLFVPQARAQASLGDSAGGPAFRLPYRYAPLGPVRVAALAPGGRLGPRLPPALVAAAWADGVRAALARGVVPASGVADTGLAALAALAAPPGPTEPRVFQGAGATGVLGQFAALGMDLSLRFELKADQFRNLQCSTLEQQQAVSGCHAGFPTITPNPQYAIRSGGVVGQRLHVNVDFDSQREFDANNNLQVWYEGLEDEILKRVEAGNVSFQVPGSRFISAAIPANNFGVQAVTQFGPIEVRGIYAQQKGNVVRDRSYTVGATTTEPIDRQFRDLDYEPGRFFFVIDPTAIPGYPAVDILNINPPSLPDSLRVANLQVYRVRALNLGTNQNIGGIHAVACGPGARAVDCTGERAGPFDWELLVAGKDYYMDPSGTWVALASRLDPNDYLAVSYIPAGQEDCVAPNRCVGTYPVVRNPDTTVVDTLRLVYDPRPGVTAASPSFRFEIRSAYRLGGQDLARASVALGLAINQRERPDGSSDTYLDILGLALANDVHTFDQYNRLFPRDRDPGQGAPLHDYYVVFPHLQPFADSTKLIPAERNDSLYRTPRTLLAQQGPPSLFALQLHGDASAGGDRGSLSLSSFQIREGSEKLYLGNTLLQRDRDYTIDYTVGMVTFKNPDSLFTSGPAVVRAQFEERATFAVAPTSIYGMAATYDLGDVGQVHLTGLFQKEQTIFTRPQLGFEPASGFIGGVSTNLRFQPQWITRAVNLIPGVKSDAPSFLTVSGEVALSRPRPNPLGQAYIEEFEAQAGRFISLDQNAWHWGSVPSSPRGATAFGIPGTGFDLLDAVPLTWQSLPCNLDLKTGACRLVQFTSQQIDPTIVLLGQAQSAEPVLWLMLKPDTMMGLADSRTGNPNWRRPGSGNNARPTTRWRSITQTLSATGIDLSRVEYLEFWVWEDNLRTAKANRAAVVFDFGSVFEDALAFVPETLTVSPGGDTTYSGVRIAGQGRLDTERDPVTHAWSASINDEGILSDRVVDGIRDATGDSLIDTLPLCSASVSGQIVSLPFGDPRSRCGRHNGAVDTEDQDGDGSLDVVVGAKTTEDFVRFVFPVGDERFYVRDGGMIPAAVNVGGGASGWRLYRIPFRTDTLQVGSPNLRQVQAVRITVLAPETAAPGEPDPQVFFALSRVRLVGATWLKRAETPMTGLGGERGTGLGEIVASVVSTENRDLGYAPPPGVANQGTRQDQNFAVGATQINEQSLRLLASGLQPGQRAEAFTRFGSEGDKNFLKYRQLRVWARGRGPGWEDGDLEFFLKVGKDADNFYFYHSPARTSSWEPEVVIALDRWVQLRGRIQQAWLRGDPPQVYPGCPDSTLVPNDTAWVMCDGPYIAHVRDPGGAPPNLAAVQEVAAGIWRVRATTFVDQAEVWVDDIRLSDVVQTAGTAEALDVALTAGNLADVTLDLSRRDGNFRQLGEDPTYQTTQAYNLITTVHLERLLPHGWGLAAPLQVRYTANASDPVFLSGTDLRGAALSGLRTPVSRAKSFAFSLRRARRAASGPARWLADPLSLTASYTTGEDRSSLSEANARAYAVAADYGVQPGGVTIPAVPGFLVGLFGKSGFAADLARARWRLSPTSIRLRSVLSGSDADRTSFRVPVADSGDIHLAPARSRNRVWRNTASVDMLPLPGVQLRGDLSSTRDLRDYGDSSSIARVARLARKSLFGLDVGTESQRTVGTFYGVTPRAVPWLSPRFSLTTGFSLTRDLNGHAPIRTQGDSGAFRLPTAFSNLQRVDLGTQVDLGRLGRGLFGDSSFLARGLAKITALDLGLTRDRASNFSSLSSSPSLSYQLGLAGFDAFRSQLGIPATSATDNTSRRAAGTMGLPLGLRLTALYQVTRGTSWLLRLTGQVATSTRTREWPSGNLSWTVSPPRSSIGRFLSGLTAQLAVRYRQTFDSQPGFGGVGGATTAVTQTSERSLAPGITASWAHGILTTVDGTRLRTEQRTAGNTFQTTRTQRNASVAFAWRPPAGLLRLKSDIRTTARYSYTMNTTCLQPAGQPTCNSFVDSRQTNAQVTLDTSFPPSLSAGFQMAYVLDDERQINRKIAQLVLTAFVQLNTSVGQVR
jgi:motility/secretion related protein SprA